MKKIVILDNTTGRLCNKLWNYISIYAYCRERGYTCQNYSFYRYDQYFDFPDKPLGYRIFLSLNAMAYRIRKNRITHRLYRAYGALVYTLRRNHIIDSNRVFYLPPTTDEKIMPRHRTTYFTGWLFRNPVGIEKYRTEIHAHFLPQKPIRDTAEQLVASLRERYTHVVGVHIRQGDYKGDVAGATGPSAKIYLNEKEVSQQLHDYLAHSQKDATTTCFMICSDEAVDSVPFQGLNIVMGPGKVMEDLYALSLADLIIGSNSTFGAFASYYGNIPLIVFDKNGIDWEYYRGKTTYFENAKCLTVHYS